MKNAGTEDKRFPWKTAAINLATCVVMMTGYWLTSGREFVTRAEVNEIVREKVITEAEVSQIVKRDAPYNDDKAMVLARLTDNTEVARSLTEAVVALRITIGRLEERLNTD